MPEWIQVVIRTLMAIAVLFVLTKVLGKRQVSQLSLFEYITGITIGSIAGYVSMETDEAWYLGTISLIVWVVIVIAIEFLQLKSKTVRDILDGKATVLVKDGKILEDNLTKERITVDEFLEQMRKKDIFQVADVEFAVMEPSGTINILPKAENLPITPKMLGIKVAEQAEPQVVVMDGNVMDDSLAKLGLNRGWLETELEKQGVAIENVLLGQVDSYGQLYIDLYDDQIQVPEAQEKPALLATLKKCEADIEMFSLSTKDEKAKQMYQQCSEHLQQVIDNVKPYLRS
ncbi:DUF421 domain-containing protein [Risungbinella massiliensis]|uniref:DUF421 domain-containing protein n=1 Tax=Risungbinella massiliensis TaxID=1329796 RepID=UPI0005CBF08E|nr:DUF421 domain-containing protein [Risungbinella massiliensis]